MELAIYNPLGREPEQLPVIYGFNNGGSRGLLHAQLIAEDGTPLGSHCCSHEAYMPGDLGLIAGRRADRHEHFREHYPEGYRMAWVGYDDVDSHAGLNEAFRRNEALKSSEEQPLGAAGEAEAARSAPDTPNQGQTNDQ